MSVSSVVADIPFVASPNISSVPPANSTSSLSRPDIIASVPLGDTISSAPWANNSAESHAGLNSNSSDTGGEVTTPKFQKSGENDYPNGNNVSNNGKSDSNFSEDPKLKAVGPKVSKAGRKRQPYGEPQCAEGKSKISELKGHNIHSQPRKRRNRIHKEEVKVPEDGYKWRKYGQKNLIDTPYTRTYFSCAFKQEGCSAKKTVDRHSTDSSFLRISYEGKHSHALPAKAIREVIVYRTISDSALQPSQPLIPIVSSSGSPSVSSVETRTENNTPPNLVYDAENTDPNLAGAGPYLGCSNSSLSSSPKTETLGSDPINASSSRTTPRFPFYSGSNEVLNPDSALVSTNHLTTSCVHDNGYSNAHCSISSAVSIPQGKMSFEHGAQTRGVFAPPDYWFLQAQDYLLDHSSAVEVSEATGTHAIGNYCTENVLNDALRGSFESQIHDNRIVHSDVQSLECGVDHVRNSGLFSTFQHSSERHEMNSCSNKKNLGFNENNESHDSHHQAASDGCAVFPFVEQSSFNFFAEMNDYAFDVYDSSEFI